MDNEEEVQGVKFSEFPSATPGDSDEVVGLHNDDNARFSVANFILAIRQGLANIFVPLTRTINGKALNNDISLSASDVGAVDTADVGVADGVASLDSTGKVPSAQLPPIPSDASDIEYDNTQSGLTATDVQEAIDELAQGGGGSAANVTYDPTLSGLTATNVQDAIDEVVDDLDDKQASITASGILKGDGQGGVTAATAGTDYATPAQLDEKANPGQIGYPETGTTASQNYTAGEYICWNGLTYTADTNIATGTTLSASGGNKNLTECVGGGLNKFAPVSGQWTPNSNASAITDRCYYLIVGNLMVVNIAVYLTTALNNHTEVEIISDLASTFGRSVRTNAVISCPAVFFDVTVTSLVLRTVIVNNKLYIRNDSGASIRTNYAIYGQIMVPVN